MQPSQPDPPRNEPIAWLRAFKREVQPTTFKKGREYAQSRRVSGMTREGDRITARVTGQEGQPYEVWFAPEEPARSHCTCASWNEYGPHCKHVVAVALIHAARTRSAMNAANPAPDAAGGVARDEAGPVGETLPLPALAKLEGWLGLSSLPDYDLLYRLTPASAGGRRTWLVDVRRRDQQATGPLHVKRMLVAGARLSPADERIFHELSRHESRYDARLILNDEDLSEVLPLLAGSRVIYRGTPLVFSEQPAHLQVHLEQHTEGATATLEFRLPPDLALPLRDGVILVGRRSHLICGQTVYAIEPVLPARLWRRWLLEPTMSFSSGQLDRVLTFFAAHLPRFELSLRADGVEVDEEEKPRFLLTLEGSPEHVIARLAARYGQTTVPVSPTALHLGYASAVGEGSKKLYRRREDEERAASKELTARGLKYDANANVFEATRDTALQFWSEGLASLPSEWERYGAQAPKVRVRPKLRPRIRVGMSGVRWFELESEFVTDDQVVDLGAVRMWLDSGRRFVPLKDGTFAEADPAELKRAADLLEEAGAKPGAKTTQLPLYQAVALDLLGDLGDVTRFEEKARAALVELKGSGEIHPVAAPSGFEATLRHYQELGLGWLHFLHRHGLSGILADDMGLGKTVQALALLQSVKNDEGPQPSLVVAPTSVLPNWQREAERFTPGLSVLLWHGQDRKELGHTLAESDIILTSYALVRRDRDALSEVPFRYVLLDEAQNIKNADSATAQACKSLPAQQKLALTGTPLENRLSELWSIFDFVMPGFLGSADTFGERYEAPIQGAGDPEVRERLRRRIQPFVLRRLKTEVAKDLPPKTDTVAYCEMEPGQAALYREVLEESRKQVHDTIEKMGFKRSRVSILAALMKLRQVCCDPRLLKLPPDTLLPSSAKLQRFRELTDDLIAEGHRALVFSQFTEMLGLLKEQADERKIPYMYLDGRTKDRMSRVDEFNSPSGPPLFFISLKAGGTGLNLTAADYVIHYDPWWNPAVEDQATDRAHRIGQTQAVIAYKLITRGTVEEKILALQRRKRDLAEGVLGSGDGMLASLSEHDVEDLFKLEE